MDPLTDDIVEAIRQLNDVIERPLGAGSLSIPPVQYRALVILSQGGALNHTNLSDRLSLQPSTVTRLCDRLLDKGLIFRRASPTSGREIELSVSPRGVRVLNAVAESRRKAMSEVLATLSPSQRSTIREALVTLAQQQLKPAELGTPGQPAAKLPRAI